MCKTLLAGEQCITLAVEGKRVKRSSPVVNFEKPYMRHSSLPELHELDCLTTQKFFFFVTSVLTPHGFHILRLFIFFSWQPGRRDSKTSQVLHLANCFRYRARFTLLTNRAFFHIWLVLVIYSSVNLSIACQT